MTLNLRVIAEWAGAILVITAVLMSCLSWLDGRIKAIIREVDLTCEKRIQEAVKMHDHDTKAHANHDNTVTMNTWMAERRAAMDMLKEHLSKQDVVMARVDSKLESMGENIERLQKAHDEAIAKGLCLYQQAAIEARARA